MSIHDLEEHVIEAAERWAAAHVRSDDVTPEEAALLDAVDALSQVGPQRIEEVSHDVAL